MLGLIVIYNVMRFKEDGDFEGADISKFRFLIKIVFVDRMYPDARTVISATQSSKWKGVKSHLTTLFL